MRIAVGQLALGDEAAGLGQRLHDPAVGIAGLAVGVIDHGTGQQRDVVVVDPAPDRALIALRGPARPR